MISLHTDPRSGALCATLQPSHRLSLTLDRPPQGGGILTCAALEDTRDEPHDVTAPTVTGIVRAAVPDNLLDQLAVRVLLTSPQLADQLTAEQQTALEQIGDALGIQSTC